MRRFSTWLTAAGALGLAALGCSSSKAPGSEGPGFEISVAPLDLPLMSDACYELTVYNATGAPFDASEAVWTQPSLCASQYGANGGIRFTGICDAQAGTNSIRLVLNDVYQGGTFETGTALTVGEDYINPCPPAAAGEDNGCVLEAACNPNEDTKIEFNLTVMRNAELGFFDTVVRFQDVFCAAKLDCVENDGQTTLEYLYDPATQSDGPTAVLGFVCLGGSGADISMYLDDITVDCEGGDATIDVSGGPGNLGSPDLTQTGNAPLFGAAVNTGAGFQGSHYWNVLLGMNLDANNGSCTLTTSGTVSETELTDNETSAHNRYPYITWSVQLSDGATRTCTRHPLDGGNGVATTYTEIDTPVQFDHQLALAPSVGPTLNAAPAYTAPCADHADCDPGDGCYFTGWAGMGQCAPLNAITFCTGDGDCGAGEFCFDEVDDTPYCMAQGTLGPACDSAWEANGAMCPAGTFCDGHFCREVGQVGALCDGQTSNPTCAEGLYCDANQWPSVCVPSDVAQGGACQQWSTWMNQCQPGLTCVTGTCQPPLGVGGGCQYDSTCQAGLICSDLDGTCQSPLANGQTCFTNNECQGGACINNTCADDIAAGGACDTDNGQGQCAPGYFCDGISDTCQAWVGDSTHCEADSWCADGQTCVSGAGWFSNCQ